MNRILFAAARGARLDWYDTFTHMWHPNVVNVPVTAKFKSIDMYYRIHPDDAHLQYGPVSTALRDGEGDMQAIDVYSSCMPALAIHAAIVTGYASLMLHEWSVNKDLLTRSLFLLILAEALADSGL